MQARKPSCNRRIICKLFWGMLFPASKIFPVSDDKCPLKHFACYHHVVAIECFITLSDDVETYLFLFFLPDDLMSYNLCSTVLIFLRQKMTLRRMKSIELCMCNHKKATGISVKLKYWFNNCYLNAMCFCIVLILKQTSCLVQQIMNSSRVPIIRSLTQKTNFYNQLYGYFREMHSTTCLLFYPSTLYESLHKKNKKISF